MLELLNFHRKRNGRLSGISHNAGTNAEQQRVRGRSPGGLRGAGQRRQRVHLCSRAASRDDQSRRETLGPGGERNGQRDRR